MGNAVRDIIQTTDGWAWNVLDQRWIRVEDEIVNVDGFDEWGLDVEVAPSPLR